MTTLTLELVAELARIETEDRVRRAERRREAAESAGPEPGFRRRMAGMLFARAPRRTPSPAAGETLPSSTFASSRATPS
jgi:hypothetical protein